MPDAWRAIERVKDVAPVVETDLSNRDLAPPEGDLLSHKWVVKTPGALKLLQTFRRRDPNASADWELLLVWCHDVKGGAA